MTDFMALMTAPLAHGSHESWDGSQCVMERVSMLWALNAGLDLSASFSDLPACTNEVIARAAQVVNDRLSDEERQKLNAFLPRLLRARRTDSDARVNVRLALWAARRVLHLVREQDRTACERAIEATALWLSGEASIEEVNAAANAAAANAAAANATAAAAAANATATYAAFAPLQFLDELLDAWEEAVTKEGEDLYVPQAWEDEALAWVSEYMEASDA